MLWGKNIEIMAMKAGQLELKEAQMEHGKSYCGEIVREVEILA